nr:DNA cytosine methyltransferase [uncultured Cohaesibacter sp.]
MLDLFPAECQPDLAPIIIDSFAGGGGASTGIEMATGRSPDFAINHDAAALAMHAVNHPTTRHLLSDVFALDIRSYTLGREVWGLWASPDCTHFSRARGGKPTSKRVRGLAWVIVEFAQKLGPNRPSVIFMENVEEFLTWEDFESWKAALGKLGYRLEWKALRACDYGAPTIRKRLFIIMRRDGRKIRWPAPTHGAPDSEGVLTGKLKPWRTAAEIIDWSQPCHSIFLSKEEARAVGVKRPLAENTLKRIAAGIKRFVIDAENPFILNMTHGGRLEPIDEPLRTVTGANRGEKAVVVPTLVQSGYGERLGQKPRSLDIQAPLGTIVAGGGKHALVAAFLAQHNNDSRRVGGVNPGRSAHDPVSTITTRGTQTQLVCSSMVSLRGTTDSQIDKTAMDVRGPVPTISAGGNHAAEVRAFLIKYYGAGVGQSANEPLHTITTNDRFGLTQAVTLSALAEEDRYNAWWVARWYEQFEPDAGCSNLWGPMRPAALIVGDHCIVDVGMRMLTPRELFRAQGFPDDYKIDVDHNGRKLSKTEQIAKCGNSVCPPVAEAIVRANMRGVA